MDWERSPAVAAHQGKLAPSRDVTSPPKDAQPPPGTLIDTGTTSPRVEISRLGSMEPAVVRGVVRHFAESNGTLADAFFGGDIPTKMIFAPEISFPASLHYMFFPRGTVQEFHWHPGGRHLVVLGDTELTIRFNGCDEATNPYTNPTTRRVRPNTWTAIRFPSHTWHEFSSTSAAGTGIVAFSFHDTDDLISSSPRLMQELSTFWHSDSFQPGTAGAGNR
jgi:hypothetical protein